MHKYTVAFRIEGRFLVPSEVSDILGLQPSHVWVHPSDENYNGRNSLWSYGGSTPQIEWDSLEDGLLHVLGDLFIKKDLIDFKFAECKKYWWCGHFQQSFDGGPRFSPDLFRKLADFGVPLFLDNYFSSDD
ncbi:hypothetical protein [Undibacterium sp. Ji49W]|uniref:hypothetical protein n=1 Tax=Undibacterium sp. Ji49W TaxID=3413040 RepID=UPI003BF3229D